MLCRSLNPDFLIFLQKRRAPKNDEIWRRFRAEISHMRPIQARKLKLLKTVIWDLAYYFLSSYFIIPQPAYYLFIVIFYSFSVPCNLPAWRMVSMFQNQVYYRNNDTCAGNSNRVGPNLGGQAKPALAIF